MAAPSLHRPPSSPPSALGQRVRLAVLVRLTFVLAALGALVASASVAGCGSSDDCKPGTVEADNNCGKQCVQKGGLVENGACVAKCDPKDCVANNTCVNNLCQLECTSYKDCQLGTQDCLPAKEDGTGKDIFTCQSSNKAPFATSCPFGTECDALKACPNGDSCDYTQCGGAECKKDDASCAGIPNCSLGLCADGKTACTVPGCAQEQCVSLICITKGAADANAYCSLQDCNQDSDCPSSFVCGITRDAHDICDGSNMTLKEKGNNGFCGSTDAGDCSAGQPCPSGTYCDADGRCTGNCIAPSKFGDMGHTYFEGSVCLLRKTCLERKLCDPCEVDGQCANLPGGACVAIGGEKRCTVGCAKDSDCQPDYKCDANYCQPRFGKCVGDGNFCDPCLSDEDCGDKTTRKACVSGSRNQQACEDLAFPKACKADADCDKDSNGDPFHCWGGDASPHVFQKLDKASGQLPEGLVMKGTVAYVGYSYTGEIVTMNIQGGTKAHFASGPDLMNGANGLMLGLAFNPTTQELYFGVASFNAAVQAGIYKVPSTGGAATLVASDPQLTFPNGLAFDSTGNLYVTESANGLIFKVVGSTATVWLDDPTLKPNATNCTPNTPFPLGANGMFLTGSGASAAMIVSNTNLAQIVKIPINMDGTPGAAAIIAGPDCNTLGGIDGIVNDAAHLAILGVLNTQNKMIRVPIAGGAVTTAFSGTPLNGPASVALVSLFGQEAVITNSDFSGGSEGPGVLTLINNDSCMSASQCGVFHTCQACDADIDCPKAPSGLHGHCYGAPWDGGDSALTSGDLPPDECVPLLYQGQIYCEGYKSCGLPIPDIATLQTGCW